jgi:hypothetical protein
MLLAELLGGRERWNLGIAKRTGVALVLAGLLASSWSVTRSWASDRSLWIHAYQSEPSPRSLANYIRILLEDGKISDAIPLASRLIEWAPHNPESIYLYCRTTYLDPSLSREEKILRISSRDSRDGWRNYYLASLLVDRGDFENAWQTMFAALDHPYRFGGEFSTVLAEAVFFCTRAHGASCERLRLRFEKVCESWPENRLCRWDQSAYIARLVSLGLCDSRVCRY